MPCGLCRRQVATPNPPVRGVALCGHCFGSRVRVRVAASERTDTPKVRTFYVSPFGHSTSNRVPAAPEYVVKRISRRMTCTCPDYVHRGQVENDVCKHVRVVRFLVKAAGGIDALPAGAVLEFTLNNDATTRRPTGRGRR